MRCRIRPVLWCVGLVLAGCLAAVTPAAATPTEIVEPADDPGITERLRRDGHWIVDEHGRVMLLRGANQVWKGEPWVAPVEPGALDDTTLSAMAAHGWNVVRLGVYPKGLMPTRGEVDEGYLDRVVEAVDAFADHGIHVLLDVHQDIYSGFPDWMVPLDEPVGPGTVELLLQSAGIDMDLPPLPLGLTIGQLRAMEPDLGFPLNGFRPSMILIWDAFWGNDHVPHSDPKGLLDHTADMLAALAGRVADHPAVVGVEIMNESNPGSPLLTCLPTALVVGCPVVDRITQDAWQSLTDAMRDAAGEDLMVWWEPNVTWNFMVPSLLSSPPITPEVTDPQIGFAFHDYCIPGELATYLGTPMELSDLACDSNHNLNWDHADQVAARTGWPLFVTEFGNNPNPAEAARTLAHADERFAHWVQWTNGITDRYWLYEDGESDPYAADILRQYVRSYPMATSGEPESLTFDADSGVMVYRYAPADLGVPTEFAVSDVHYPDGYEVIVTGGRVRTAPGAVRTTPPAAGDAVTTGTPTRRTVVTVDADDGVAVTEVIIRPAPPDATSPSPAEGGATGAPVVPAGAGNALPATGGGGPVPIALAALAAVVFLKAARARA